MLQDAGKAEALGQPASTSSPSSEPAAEAQAAPSAGTSDETALAAAAHVQSAAPQGPDDAAAIGHAAGTAGEQLAALCHSSMGASCMTDWSSDVADLH